MSIGLIVVVVAIAAFINLFSNKNTKVLPSSTEVKNNSNNKNKSSDTTNILLLGDTTDSMMVATVDAGNKNIKLTPVEDATYVDTSDKETLIKSLEKKTNLDLDKFLQVNVSDLLNAVSVLGDIQLNVKQEALRLINNLIPKFYAECEDGDKQKEMLISFVNGIKDVDLTKYVELFNTLKPYVNTNLTVPDMLKLASTDYEFQ